MEISTAILFNNMSISNVVVFVISSWTCCPAEITSLSAMYIISINLLSIPSSSNVFGLFHYSIEFFCFFYSIIIAQRLHVICVLLLMGSREAIAHDDDVVHHARGPFCKSSSPHLFCASTIPKGRIKLNYLSWPY